MLIKNMKVSGSTKPTQVKNKFIFTGLEKNPISDSELRNHFISEAKNLIELRKNSTIGLREKWLHSLLIEKMRDGSLLGLDLEFLYYETPVGKVKRNKQFGREHIENLKLIIIAPDMDFKNTFINASIMEKVKKLNCEAILASISSDWIKNEEMTCMTKNL